MKNIKFFLLSLIAVTLLFSACSDLSKDTSGNQEKSEYTLVGSLSLAGVSRAVYSRTATTAFSDEPVWTISAIKGEKSYLPNEVSDLAFNFTFDEAGEYLIEATALKSGTIIAQGSCLCTVSEDEENFASIIAKPVASILPGSVNLEINFDSYSANKVSSVQVEWLGFVNIDRTKQALGYPAGSELTGDAKEPEISEEVQAAIAALIDWEEQRSEGAFNTTLPVESGKAVIEMDNIFCGAQSVKLSFSDSVGNILYSCKEILNVYSGFTTNEWYGTAPYLANGKFTLTGSLIGLYGAEAVPDTDMMLYNVQYDEDNSVNGCKYYLADTASQAITNDTPATVTTTSSDNSFCFDGDGYYYVIAGKGESATYIKSNKPDFGSETLGNTIVPDSMYLYGDLGGLLTVDRFTNILYMFDGTYCEISQITKDDGEYTYKEENHVYFPAKTFSFSEDSNSEKIRESVFTVYDGVAYFASVSEGGNLVIADLENAVAGTTEGHYSITGSKLVSLELGEMNLSSVSNEATITDILYQDGAVYMLLRDVATDTWSTIYSRGALIKYDCLLGTVKTLGWTDTASALSGDKYVYTFYVKAANGYNINYRYDRIGNNGVTGEYDVLLKCSDLGENTPQLYTVSAENEESAFCGPQKFVALKPKKLLIADDGVVFYTDSIGAYKFRNKNRVVTVDLESFAIESVAEAAVPFGTDANAVPSNACSYPNLSSLSTDTPIYIYKDGSHEACGDDISEFYYHASSYTLKSSFFNSGAATYAFPCGDGEEVIDDGE